jgi:hypothetical protein
MASPLLQPLPKPAGVERAPEPQPAGLTRSGPKNETARIGTLPQPMIVTSGPLDPLDAIPRSFCWGLFGIAAFIFLIQIWNYIVS